MSSTRRHWIQSLWSPKAIFLLDGVGAIVTAVSVGLILPRLQIWIGLPVTELRVLGAVAASFALFSLSRQLLDRVTAKSLRIIATANLTYCAATALLLGVHAAEATVFAWIYFVGEIAIVLVLSLRELTLARGLAASHGRAN